MAAPVLRATGRRPVLFWVNMTMTTAARRGHRDLPDRGLGLVPNLDRCVGRRSLRPVSRTRVLSRRSVLWIPASRQLLKRAFPGLAVPTVTSSLNEVGTVELAGAPPGTRSHSST